MEQGKQALKVLQLVKTSVGAAWAFRQMRELVRLGVEVHVALPPDGPLVPEYEKAGVIVHPSQFDFPMRQPWRLPGLFRGLRDLVAHVAPDIIHSHFVGTTLTMRLALGKTHPVPRVFQVPGPLHLEHTFFSLVECLTAGPPDYWVGSCRWTCERYHTLGVSQDRVFLSYYGTDLERFIPPPKAKLRQELGIDADITLVGMVAFMYAPKWYLGQTQGLKGHEDLIDAIALCLETETRMMGVFIGGAWDHEVGYENRVRAYGKKRCGEHIVFLGTRSDVLELYPDITIAVHPSHSENVGGVVESLLYAIPTVATNIGGLPDLVVHGETGWLVPPRDPTQLAAAILEAHQNPMQAREMAERGQSLAKQLFDVKKTSQQILRIYSAISSNRSGGRT